MATDCCSGGSTELVLRRFLNCYWLRPENAFWMALRSKVLGQAGFVEPCVDLSCGDGIFSFLHAGGEFAPEFDVFCSVGHLGKVKNEHADMFDHVDENYRPPIVRRPECMSVGTDWKQALLDKAAVLGFFEKLVLHDNNTPLPFEDDSFASIHCNSAYWISAIDLFLREMCRITKPGGKVVLSVKLDAVKSYTLEKHREQLGDNWLKIIGRGRFESWPSVGDADTWSRRFEAAGLRIDKAIPFITRTHAHIWDIGLRPIAPMLVKMANSLTPETRSEIKAEWVDLFCELLEPVCREDFDLFAESSEPAEILYVLSPD